MNHNCLYSPAAEHHRIWLVLISHPAEGRRLSWPGRRLPGAGRMDTQLSTHSRAGITYLRQWSLRRSWSGERLGSEPIGSGGQWGSSRGTWTPSWAAVSHSDQDATRIQSHSVSLWLPYVIGQAIYFHPVVSSFFLLFFPRLISAVGDWMSTILPHMVWP